MPRVFDCVIVDKLDFLEARFREYQDIPEVTHVICEVAPACFPDSELAARWRGRWNHVTVEEHELPSLISREKAVRDFTLLGINGGPGDIALLEGISSLPSREAIRKLAEGKLSCMEVSMIRWRVL